MADHLLTDLPDPIDRKEWLEQITGWLAITGGVLALCAATLVTTSVLLRWLINAPIDGDFEFVKMATAITVFAYLPYTQVRRGNIMVDTFTNRLSQKMRDRIDGFWDLAYAAFTGFLSVALFNGTMDAIRSGETTMQRQILVWPSIGLAMLLCGLLCASAVVTGLRLFNRNR
jgi:TRAP-type C4-dicarboxylate transport system permease small subunit